MTALPVLIAALVILDVSLWTFRVTIMNRGDKRLAAALGAIQAVVSVTAIGQVVTNLDTPLNIAGYAIGVGVGTYIGIVADERLNRRPPAVATAAANAAPTAKASASESRMSEHTPPKPAAPHDTTSAAARHRRWNRRDRAAHAQHPPRPRRDDQPQALTGATP